MRNKTRQLKVSKAVIAVVKLFALLRIGERLYAFRERASVGRVFVTNRPDLCDGYSAKDDAWAQSHRQDFFDYAGVKIEKSRNLRIAIMQFAMGPAPETIVFQCKLDDENLKKFLRNKKAARQVVLKNYCPVQRANFGFSFQKFDVVAATKIFSFAPANIRFVAVPECFFSLHLRRSKNKHALAFG